MGGEPSQSPDPVRAQLNRIFASKLFRASELQKQFLSFVILHTLVRSASRFGRSGRSPPRSREARRVLSPRRKERPSADSIVARQLRSVVLSPGTDEWLPLWFPDGFSFPPQRR
jgi:hypothetical protein